MHRLQQLIVQQDTRPPFHCCKSGSVLKGMRRLSGGQLGSGCSCPAGQLHGGMQTWICFALNTKATKHHETLELDKTTESFLELVILFCPGSQRPSIPHNDSRQIRHNGVRNALLLHLRHSIGAVASAASHH